MTNATDEKRRDDRAYAQDMGCGYCENCGAVYHFTGTKSTSHECRWADQLGGVRQE